jgi:hypothetical protein
MEDDLKMHYRISLPCFVPDLGETATSPRFSALLGGKPCELVDRFPCMELLAERVPFVGSSAQQPAILTGIRRPFFGCLRADFQVAG